MGRIKSALEIALERTESVKSDKGSIDQYESRQRGKRLANAFLENPQETNLEGELKKTHGEQLQALKQGIFDVLISQVTLPLLKEDEKRIAAAGKGLQAVIGDPHFGALYKQFLQAITQYLNEATQYGEAIQRQYAPKLRQKEEELSRRLGRQVKIDPFQDPEFVAYYNQNINALKDNYQALVDQVRRQAQQLWKN
jgi:hemoglobin-like flavoprotein